MDQYKVLNSSLIALILLLNLNISSSRSCIMLLAGMVAHKWQKCHMTFLTRMGSVDNAFTLIPADLIKSNHIT